MERARSDSEGLPGFWWALLLFPAVALLVMFFLVPLGRILMSSIYDGRFTLHYFVRLATQPLYSKVFGITFEIAAVVTAVCLLLGYPVAYVLATSPARRSNLLLILVLVPFWTSLLVRTYAWMAILGRQGVINEFLQTIRLTGSPVNLLYSLFSVTIGISHIMLPFMILPLYGVMRGIDKNLARAAQTMGAPPFQALVRVFVPLSLPGIVAGSLLVFVLTLGFFITPALLGGPGQTMASMVIVDNVSVLLDWNLAAALSTVLLALTFLVLFVAGRIFGAGLTRIFSA